MRWQAKTQRYPSVGVPIPTYPQGPKQTKRQESSGTTNEDSYSPNDGWVISERDTRLLLVKQTDSSLAEEEEDEVSSFWGVVTQSDLLAHQSNGFFKVGKEKGERRRKNERDTQN